MSDFFLTETSDSFSLDDNGDGFSVFPGAKGEKGDPGEGVPTGGTTGQVLTKKTDADYDTEWTDPSADITVDDALSPTSENPVQNKVVTLQKAPIITDTASGAIASFPDGADGLPMKSVVCNIEPVQEGSGDPSPDNIRPISGWTGMTVQRTGKNLFDETQYQNLTTDYEYSRDSYHCKSIQLKPNTSYTVSQRSGVADSSVILLLNNVAKINNSGFFDLRSANGSKSFTTDDSGCLYIGVLYSNDTAYNARLALCQIQIELGSTATAYEPFSGTTLPISWQTEAGTVYGGNLTINEDGSCVLTVDRASVTYNSLSGFAAHGSDRWYHNGLPTGADYSKRTQAISNSAIYQDAARTYRALFAFGSAGVYVNKLSEGETLEQFSARLQENPMQICYFLATPQTYTLSSVTMLETLLGTNNIWTNVGDTAATYSADTKQFIIKKIAELNA